MLRVEIRFKNASLFNALKERFESTAEAMRKSSHGSPPLIGTASTCMSISVDALRAYLGLTRNPWLSSGELARNARTICDCLERGPEELFPSWLYSLKFPKLITRELTAEHLVPLIAAHGMESPTESPERALIARETHEAIEHALKTLDPRDEQIIRARFGLDGDGIEYTLEELGQRFGVTRGRIRELEARGLRNLRHPSRSRQLEALL